MKYEIDKKTSDRITILKGLLIVLVVFIHSYRETVTFIEGDVILHPPVWLETMKYIISQVVARCAVPGFFLMSSVLLYRKEFKWKQNMFKKVNTILIPYVFLNSFWILFFYFAQKSVLGASYFVTAQSHVSQWGITGWLEAYLGNFSDPYPILYPTWFLRDLFVLNMMAVAIKKCVDTVPKITLVLVLCLWLIPLEIPFVGAGEVSGQSLVFFVLGYYIVKYNIRMEKMDKCPLWLLTVAYGLFIMADMFFGETAFGYVLRHLTIVFGIVWFVRITYNLENTSFKPYLIRFAKHSFFVYIFHEMGLTILTKLLARWFSQTWQMQLLEYVGLPVLIIAICVLTSSILKLIMPGIYEVITGYRNK